jgi:hypothetical protein
MPRGTPGTRDPISNRSDLTSSENLRENVKDSTLIKSAIVRRGCAILAYAYVAQCDFWRFCTPGPHFFRVLSQFSGVSYANTPVNGSPVHLHSQFSRSDLLTLFTANSGSTWQNLKISLFANAKDRIRN